MQNTAKIPAYLEGRLQQGGLPSDLAGLHHPWLKQLREEALQRFLKTGLPTATNEDWRYTHLHVLEKHFSKTELHATHVPEVAEELCADRCGRAVFVDGILNAQLSELDNLPAGLTVRSLRNTLNDKQAPSHTLFPDIHGHDAWHDLNFALFDDGAYINVAAGAVIKKPLEVICLSTPQNGPTTYHARNLIHIGAHAALKICKLKISHGTTACFTTHMNQIILEEGAKFDRLVFSKHADATLTFIHDNVMVHKNARFRKTAVNLGGKITRAKTTVTLAGEHALATLGGLTHTTNDGTTDVLVDMRHDAPNTQSVQKIRSLAGGKARAVFQGKITVAKIAQKTDAAQNHQGLLLSDTAEIDAKPSLEIYADDVKCSHGNTCGALDETALFYLRSRGVPQKEAEQLLQQAFIAELFDDFEEHLRDTIIRQIVL
jgi:Fe-S cluster assembly protein SufD